MAVAQQGEQVTTDWKVGALIRGCSSLHVRVFLGQLLNPELLSDVFVGV